MFIDVSNMCVKDRRQADVRLTGRGFESNRKTESYILMYGNTLSKKRCHLIGQNDLLSIIIIVITHFNELLNVIRYFKKTYTIALNVQR